ncbi:MAG: hypothetical protein ABIV21_09450 [Pyrinomonadaceae bacterium]
MKFVTVLLAMFLAAISVSAGDPKTPEELLTAMQKKHASTWYKTLVFAQKTTSYKPDGTTEKGIWYEALSVPGRLRIDYDPLTSGGGTIFKDGTVSGFKDGKLAGSRPFNHPLLVLGFDVYFQPVQKTMDQLKGLKIDMTLLRKDVWQGRDVYVVGAAAGDLRSPQFWIDKKNLYFVRLIEPVGKDLKNVQEIQFNKYEKMKDGGWVSPEVVVIVDGKKVFTEEYYGIRTNVKLDEDLFDPQQFMTVDRTYFDKK